MGHRSLPRSRHPDPQLGEGAEVAHLRLVEPCVRIWEQQRGEYAGDLAKFLAINLLITVVVGVLHDGFRSFDHLRLRRPVERVCPRVAYVYMCMHVGG